MKRLVVCAAVALAACGPKTAEAPRTPDAETAAPAPPNAATLTAFAAPVQGDTEIDNAANVAKVVYLERDDVKLYSLTGGDPAINGDYAMLGLYVAPDGWYVYKIGDFNTWEIVEQSPDRVVLKVSHGAVVQETGEIVNYQQKLAIALPPVGEDGAPPPKEVQVTPVD